MDIVIYGWKRYASESYRPRVEPWAFLTNRSFLYLPSAIPYIFQRKSPALESVDEADGSDFLEDVYHLMLMIFNFSDPALLDKAEVYFLIKN